MGTFVTGSKIDFANKLREHKHSPLYKELLEEILGPEYKIQLFFCDYHIKMTKYEYDCYILFGHFVDNKLIISHEDQIENKLTWNMIEFDIQDPSLYEQVKKNVKRIFNYMIESKK